MDFDASILKGYPDGSRIGAAWDLSGNNRHCYRVGNSNTPKVKTNELNSFPVYNFNSNSQRLFTSVNARVPQDITMFVISKFNSAGASFPYLFAWFSAPNAASFVQSSTGVQFDYRAPNNQELSGGSFFVATSTSSYAIYCCTMNGTNKTGTIYKNGVSIGTSTNAAMSWTGFTATSSFRMNANLNDTFAGEALMPKAVIFPSLLSAQNIADIFAYLNSVWAVY